ncbi:hypothetical protein ELY21_03245 [Legionella sp. km535]|uniref:hypothetical protein n=1 Tax=Legionella sp. km535 TaxID=2498107 RepID=UPI000F8CB8E0|nr:hypothetical protein [Legionella sp. km535]RUR19626.1 hypothetical protein ELY21_03245 [Legionella sp. km535]
MIRFLFTALTLMCLINNVSALPWHHQSYKIQKSLSDTIAKPQAQQLNFSGIWEGECDNNPAVDITIKHDGTQFRISYGFMEEQYELGEIKSSSSSNSNETKLNTTTVRWSNDYSALIFINTDFFVNQARSLNVFFSKVTMTLMGSQLLIKGHYYHSDGSIDDVNEDVISCVYHHK